MAVTTLITDAQAEANPIVKAVFDDIRETRGSDFVNNIWRALAADPPRSETHVGECEVSDGEARCA